MRWFILMATVLSVVQCRPQTSQDTSGPSVELIQFPNGLRFPKWLPLPNHQLQYVGNLHYPLLFDTNNIFSSPTIQFKQIQYTSNGVIQIKKEKEASLENQKENIQKSKDHVTLLTTEPVNSANISPPPLMVSSMTEIVRLGGTSKKSNIESLKSSNGSLTLTKPPSLAPYRFHPLFHYLKNQNTIQKERIIKFRNEDKSDDVTTLILKPVARSVAGPEGLAISTPLSKAILRQGTNVDVLFEPDAVAIAGPGGIAHAESNLEISYEDV